jgi:hypothetical protein
LPRIVVVAVPARYTSDTILTRRSEGFLDRCEILFVCVFADRVKVSIDGSVSRHLSWVYASAGAPAVKLLPVSDDPPDDDCSCVGFA